MRLWRASTTEMRRSEIVESARPVSPVISLCLVRAAVSHMRPVRLDCLYGFAYTQFPFRMMEQFRALEREAREARRGLWATR
jgi:hypothetical protein